MRRSKTNLCVSLCLSRFSLDSFFLFAQLSELRLDSPKLCTYYRTSCMVLGCCGKGNTSRNWILVEWYIPRPWASRTASIFKRFVGVVVFTKFWPASVLNHENSVTVDLFRMRHVSVPGQKQQILVGKGYDGEHFAITSACSHYNAFLKSGEFFSSGWLVCLLGLPYD